ncbi:MAG: DNA mismatch repair protein MutS [Rhodothermales bacterium]|nr:DNA mismatch repair protein MutS [Rhodothermales bacterium]
MRQYFAIKEQHPDTILLFRMGDFYETFADDARQVHDTLGITLTKRANGQAADVALAGFPHHAIDNYLPKLVRAGYRVAICEQLEDPKAAKGIVERGVVEVVTPGVTLRDELLEPKHSTFLAGVFAPAGTGSADGAVGLSFVDASTGEFRVAEISARELEAVIESIAPSEIVAPKSLDSMLSGIGVDTAIVTHVEDWVFGEEYARETLTGHFDTHSLKGFGVDDMRAGLVAAGAVLHYLQDTQKGSLPHVRRLERYATADYMALDPQTRRNLELVATMQSGGRDGSLIGILDRTRTAMGGRLLRYRVLRPLRDLAEIEARLDRVQALTASRRLREALQELLSGTGDLERIAARICTGRASPRDISALKDTLGIVPDIVERLGAESLPGFDPIREGLVPCDDIVELLDRAVVDDPPATLKDGGVIRDGYSDKLDELRSIAGSGKDWLARLQKKESERTGIPSLKVGFNKVFGYYLEITNTHRDKVPDEYIRKQTLVNAERYITQDLKEYEEKILGAEEKILDLESRLFSELRDEIALSADRLQKNARILARIDVLCSLAEVAVQFRYVRPLVHDGRDIEIEQGRHPVVERVLPPGEPFIPNSIRVSADDEQILIITGPNMAGKSVVLRQVGLIVLLTQIGAFVPAESARIGLVDRVFTRVGASDNLAAGESTFLVEMNETANILNNATDRSLILLDEVGRGTSTFDGLSIAWALVEYLHASDRVAARTLFATHYHELNVLETRLERVRNYRVQVREHEGRVIFLRKLIRGGADTSYGIEVARMAGLPDAVIRRAREIMHHLEAQDLGIGEGSAESRDGAPSARAVDADRLASASGQMSMFGPEPDPVVQEVADVLEALDPDAMTPIEALLEIAKLNRKLKDR